MPYGSKGTTNGGGVPPGVPSPGWGMPGSRALSPSYEKVDSISYVASGADSHQILSINRTTSSTTTPISDPNAVLIENIGIVPVVVMLGYETYVSGTVDITDTATSGVFIHTLLLPGETLQPHLRSVISLQMETLTDTVSTGGFADRSLWNLEGTVVSWTAPGTTLKQDSGADVKNNTLNNTTDPVTFEVGLATHSKLFRVGDLLRIENEIIEVLGTYEDDPTDSSLSAGNIRCKRGMYGSDNAAHSGTPNVEFPYFNKYAEFDKYASAGYAQTDENGRYASNNMFGLGRNDSTSPMGIVPGTFCLRFYSSGYQELGLQNITSSTNTGLAASTEYGFDITVDGSGLLTSDDMKFTTDTTNLNFGGINGVISKIQAVLDSEYYDDGSAIFQEKVTVGIVNGDIRFTSGSHLTTSAILIAAPSAGETTPFGVGRFPAIGNIKSPIASSLPEGKDLVRYDPITYSQSKDWSQLAIDTGMGNIIGKAVGDINYETGKWSIGSAPPNANFEYSVAHSSPFSGKRDAQESSRANGLVAVHANVLNKNMTGELKVKLF